MLNYDELFGDQLPDNYEKLMEMWREYCPNEEELDRDELEAVRESFLAKFVW